MWIMIIAMMLGAQPQPNGAPVSGPVAPAQSGPLQPNPAQDDPTQAILQASVADIQAGKNAEALTLLDPLAASLTERYSKANVPMFCAHSAAEAKSYMARATRAAPTVRLLNARFCDVLFLRGYALENVHRLPEAAAQLLKLIDLEPEFPHVWVEYAATLRQANNYTAALAAYRRAIAIAAPNKSYAFDQAAAWRGVGFILTEQNDMDGAEDAYRKSLILAPDHPVALKELQYIAHLRETGVKSRVQTLESNLDPHKAPVPAPGQ